MPPSPLGRDLHSEERVWPRSLLSSPMLIFSSLSRRHLRSSLRRGTRSSAASWATTTVSHALLGNFEVMVPTL